MVPGSNPGGPTTIAIDAHPSPRCSSLQFFSAHLGDTVYDAVYIGVKGNYTASLSSGAATLTDDEAKKILAAYLQASEPH